MEGIARSGGGHKLGFESLEWLTKKPVSKLSRVLG